ncbi:MAG: TatD family hydrolase [Chloroherpetonaceae bacterium]|nr:TatD family hydrolase [Chloroherpetonaceae bacterium]
MFVDTHAHLSFEDYDQDRDEVMARLKAQGVRLIINPGTSVETSQAAIALAEQCEFIYANVGLHPNDVHPVTDDDFQKLDELAAHPKVVAIGEIGLDYHYPDANPVKQEHCFREMLRLAKRRDLPVVIHTRDAWHDTFRILEEEKSSNLRGMMHCFSGGVEEAERAIALGFKISIPGIVTFKKLNLPEVVAAVPLSEILTETDCPYLAPVPHRGKRNEPAFVVEVAKKIASVKGLAVEQVGEMTYKNACALFQLRAL